MDNSTLNCLVHYYVSGVHYYRVRGVDGSFAQHLTVESYMVIIFQQSYILLLINLVFHHALTLSFQVCLHILSHRSLSFFSSGFTTWIPQTGDCHFLAYKSFTFDYSLNKFDKKEIYSTNKHFTCLRKPFQNYLKYLPFLIIIVKKLSSLKHPVRTTVAESHN